jgi:hypothetical protein
MQPKSKQTFHHEGREEHEVKNFKSINLRILRTTIVENFRGLRKFCPLFLSPPSPGEKTFLCSLRSLWLNSFHSWLRLCRAGSFVLFVVNRDFGPRLVIYREPEVPRV